MGEPDAGANDEERDPIAVPIESLRRAPRRGSEDWMDWYHGSALEKL